MFVLKKRNTVLAYHGHKVRINLKPQNFTLHPEVISVFI